MYDWLRKKQREFYVLFCVAEARGTNKLAWDYDTSVQFVNWLERTGATPWRSVEDGLPEEGQEIFALHCDPMAALFNGFHAEARTYCAVDNLKWMAYWMPVPPLPKESE